MERTEIYGTIRDRAFAIKMMTINPPGLVSKSFEYYKQKLLAWHEVTEVCKSKQGIIIALLLPDDHPFQIKEKVFNQISLDDLRKEMV